MEGKTKKSQLMASWKKKWGENKHLENKIGNMVGSANKEKQLEFLTKEYDNLSYKQADEKMKLMGFSSKERGVFIKNNKELSRIFGVKDETIERPLTKREKRRIQKKQELNKKFNIKSSRDVASDIKSKKLNRLDGVYKKGAGTAKEYGYANVEEEGHHDVTALRDTKKSASIVKTGSDSVVKGRNATGLTGGDSSSGIAKGGRPIGL